MKFSIFFCQKQNHFLFSLFIFVLSRYAQGVVPTVAKYSTSPIGLVKTTPGHAIKSVYEQHGEYYVGICGNSKNSIQF